MLISSREKFAEWLFHQLEDRGWSQSELSRRSGIARPHISRIITGERAPGLDFYRKIAWALRIPLCDVLAAAGEIPSAPDHDPDLAFLTERLMRLPEARRARAYELIHALLDALEQHGDMVLAVLAPSEPQAASPGTRLHEPRPEYVESSSQPIMRTRDEFIQLVNTLSEDEAREVLAAALRTFGSKGASSLVEEVRKASA